MKAYLVGSRYSKERAVVFANSSFEAKRKWCEERGINLMTMLDILTTETVWPVLTTTN